MLTQRDVEEVESIVRRVVKEEIRFIPTKDDFFNRMDQLMGEVQAMREDFAIIGSRTSEHTDEIEDHEVRLSKVENHLHLPTTT